MSLWYKILVFFGLLFSVFNLNSANAETVSIKNGQIEYYQLGNGTPIVLIPGYVTDVSSWDNEFINTLATEHRVIMLNNRNVGRSVIKSTRYESKDLAEDTFQLIQALNLKKPAVLGISMGGMIAQQLAVLHGRQLGKLILINTAIAGNGSIRPSLETQNKLLAMPDNKIKRFWLALELFFPSSWRFRMAYALAMDRFQPANYLEVDPAAIIPSQRNLLFQWGEDNNTAKKIRQVQLPVLVLNGEADVVLPPKNSDILARTFSRAKLVRFKEGGHAMIYQYPHELAQAINHFIAMH